MSSTINAKNEQEEKDGQIKKKSRKTVKRRLGLYHMILRTLRGTECSDLVCSKICFPFHFQIFFTMSIDPC